MKTKISALRPLFAATALLHAQIAALSAVLGFLLSGLPAQAQNCAPVPSGLIGWWKGEGNASDSAGANHGALMSGATFAVGIVGQAFSFDGVNDAVKFGDVLDDVFAGPDKRFTIDLWVKVNALSNALLVGKLGDSVEGPEDQRQFGFIVRPDGSLDFGWSGSLDIGGFPAGRFRVIRANTKLTTGVWYHLAVA